MRPVAALACVLLAGCVNTVPVPTPTTAIVSTPSAVAIASSSPSLSPTPSPSTPQPTRTPAATPSASPRETPTAEDERLVAALTAFARARDARTFAALSFTAQVGLGLDDQIPLPRAATALARAEGWVLDVNEFNGHVGPFSALDLLARNVPTTISIGPHPHCAMPATPTPAALADMRRISVQPKDIDTCLKWWSVDVYVTSAGRISTVSLDLWNP